MNTVMSGGLINEYRLAIPLAPALQEKVNEVRQVLHKKHKVEFPFFIKPSLTLLRCHAYDASEAKFLERLQNVALGLTPFGVDLQDFSAYPSHTIYINVCNKSPFNEVVKQLKKFRRLLNIPDHQPHYIPEPHLIIAQKLKPFEFKKLWLECEHSSFSGKFIADRFFIYKRNEIQKHYQLLRTIEFQNLPMQVKQGQLFG